MSSSVQHISTAGVKHPALNRALSFLYRQWIMYVGKNGKLTEEDMMAMYKNFLRHQFPTFKKDISVSFAVLATRVIIHMRLVKYDSQSKSFIASADAVAEYSLLTGSNIVFADGQELYDVLKEAYSYYYSNKNNMSRVDHSYWDDVRQDARKNAQTGENRDKEQKVAVSSKRWVKDFTGQTVEHESFVRQPEANKMLSVFYNVWKLHCGVDCSLNITHIKKIFKAYFKTEFPDKVDVVHFEMAVLASDIMIHVKLLNFDSHRKIFTLNMEAVNDYDLDDEVVKASELPKFYIHMHRIHSSYARKGISLASSSYFDSLPLDEPAEDKAVANSQDIIYHVPEAKILRVEPEEEYQVDINHHSNAKQDKESVSSYERDPSRGNPNPKLVSAYADSPFFKQFISTVTSKFRDVHGNSRVSKGEAVHFFDKFYLTVLDNTVRFENVILAEKTVSILINLGILENILHVDVYWMSFGVIRELELPEENDHPLFFDMGYFHGNVHDIYKDLKDQREAQDKKKNINQGRVKSNGVAMYEIVGEQKLNNVQLPEPHHNDMSVYNENIELKRNVNSLEETVRGLKQEADVNKHKTDSLKSQLELLKSQIELMNMRFQNANH